ncbi:MAG: hypothetical protein U9Q95_02515 [Candidatus Eisenbacteria bacterium]|nr:hypothetical protein [Candidatus Eisenbacteria bacterium]
MSFGRFILPGLLACCLLLPVAVATAEPAASESPPTEPESARSRIARPPADVPLNHWSYPLLERLQSRRVIDIDLSTRPVSRSVVADAVSAARRSEATASGSLSAREVWFLSRLEAEFVRGEVDTPAFSTGSGAASFGLGVRLFTQMRHGAEVRELNLWPGRVPGGITPLKDAGDGAGGDIGDEADRGVGVEAGADAQLDVASAIGYEIWGGVEGLIGFYTDTQVLLVGQDGARQVQLSSRVKTWRGASASAERAYVKFERPSYSVMLGRRGTAWGHSRWGRLLLSGTAPTFDQLNVKYEVGALSFEAMHAFLEYEELGTETDLGDEESVFLASHRMVVRGKWGSIGFGEAVVYSSVLPDPVYLNPLMPYYMSQHNERSNDNVLWLLDGVYHVRPGLTAYGEFVIDDLQYERSTENPDKYGLTLGGAWYGAVRSFDAELTAEYTNVRNWTYTHTHTEHRFAQDGLPIGFELGPDADRFRAEFVFHPAVKWSVGTTYQHARKGIGRITDPFEAGENPEPTFPSGVVETTDRVGVELGYQSLERITAGLGAAYESVANVGNILGKDDDGWEFWVGVEFRI